MSLENENQEIVQPDNSSKAQPEKKSNKTNPIIIAVLSVLLLGSLGYNIYRSKQNNAEISNLNIDLKDTQQAKEILQNELNSLKTEFTLAQNEISKKDSILSSKDKEIFEKQSRIQSLLNKANASQQDLAEAQSLIKSLQGDIKGYKDQIASLKAENQKLTQERDSISVERDNYATKLSEEQESSRLKEENVNSTFSISNYNLIGLKVKSSGKEVESERAKRIDKLRVSFDLDKNFKAIDGEKELFIAVYKPNGQLGVFKGAQTGNVDLRSGENVKYSDKVVFNYTQGNTQHIQFDWEDYEFAKGQYRVAVYQNGFKIGEKNLTLK